MNGEYVMVERRLLSAKVTAEYLEISPPTIYNGLGLRARRPFPVKPKRIGRLVKFEKKALDAHIDGL